MNFRWGDVGTFQISPGSHVASCLKHYKDDEPGPNYDALVFHPHAILAGAGFDYVILPKVVTRLVWLVLCRAKLFAWSKARTVDALALADAEIVLEGYVNPRVTDDLRLQNPRKPANKVNIIFILNGLVIWGKAYKAPTFHCTAITMRKPESKPPHLFLASICWMRRTLTP